MEILFDIQPEPPAERVAHVERSSADLHRGGRHRGRAAAAAAAAVVGVSVDRERQGEIRLAEQLG
jgi:transposase-like protein